MRKPKELSLDVTQPPCTVHRRVKYGEGFDRREFMRMAAGTGAAVTATSFLPDEFVEAHAMPNFGQSGGNGMRLLQAACPYCGVGCGTLIKVEGGKVVGMVPDKKHPTNRGIQCIKAVKRCRLMMLIVLCCPWLNAHEPIYRTGSRRC